MVDQIQLENVEYFNYWGSTIINDAKWICEIKSRIAMVRAAFNQKRLFSQ
jgi:predicted alternative tryptophan synthase beta-subunit